MAGLAGPIHALTPRPDGSGTVAVGAGDAAVRLWQPRGGGGGGAAELFWQV